MTASYLQNYTVPPKQSECVCSLGKFRIISAIRYHKVEDEREKKKKKSDFRHSTEGNPLNWPGTDSHSLLAQPKSHWRTAFPLHKIYTVTIARCYPAKGS